MPDMLSCSQCGQPYEPTAAYCSRCGAALRSGPRADLAEAAPPRRSSNWILILVLILGVGFLALVVCLGGIALYVVRRAGPTTPAAGRAVAPSPVSVPMPPVPAPPAGGVEPEPAPMPTMPPGMVPDAAGAAQTSPAPLPFTLPTPEPDPTPDRKVRLTILCDSWRDEKRIDDFKPKLLRQFARQGIQVVADDAADKVDADLRIDWDEARGNRYAPMGAAEDEDGEEPEDTDMNRGTEITYTVKLQVSGEDEPRLNEEQTATPGGMPFLRGGQTLYDATLDQLQADDGLFAHTGALVGAALGRRGSATHLKPYLLQPEIGPLALRAITAGKIEPTDAEERALWAYAEGDMKKVIAAGPAAVPLLMAALAQRQDDYMRYGFEIDEAIAALGEIGGAEAARYLAADLHRLVGPQRPVPKEGEGEDDPENPVWEVSDFVEAHEVDHAVVLIAACAAAQAKAALPDLKKLAKDRNPDLNEAAAKALAALGE